jgi:hypothetical protein
MSQAFIEPLHQNNVHYPQLSGDTLFGDVARELILF